MSFVNFNNKQESTQETYSIRVVKEALYLAETKNINRINKIVEGFDGPLSLNEAIALFSDKLGAMQTLTHIKANALLVNEGQFSWFTQDTERQIGSEKRNMIEVYMYDNQGNQYREKKYEGYGEFGGMDYYELLARMNGYTEEDLEDIKGPFKELRQLGIDLAFGKIKTKDKKRKTLFPALVEDPRYNWKRHDFTQEAESDPNQSWFQDDEDDYEDDYYDDDDEWSDDYYESNMTEAQQLNEWGSSDQNIFLGAMHKDAGKPKKMPSPFDSKLRAAAEDAVDFYWDEWPEYKSDRAGLIDDAVRSYLRRYFKKDFEMMVRMFEPMESVQITETTEDVNEARDWGTFGTPEAKTVIKDLDKALQKFTSALAKAHNDYMKAVTLYTDGPKSDVGNKSGFNDSEGRHAVHYYTMGAIQQALGMKGFGGSLDYKVDWMYESKDWTRLMEDLGLNEGRSINKISKDHAETVSAMASTVKEWKEAEGDRKAELLDKLRMLNKKKADLEKELDDAVAGKDKNIQLALDEAEELAYLEKDLIEIYESEGILNEYSTDNFNPIEIPKKEELNSTFFKKLMPRTSKTIKDATKRIESWAGGTMFTHVQYFEVRPNGNAEDRPTYRIHNEQHWLNDTQLGWAGRSGEKVNVTKISVYDISEGEGNEIFFGKAYVDTDVYLKEHRVVFEELKRRS